MSKTESPSNLTENLISNEYPENNIGTQFNPLLKRVKFAKQNQRRGLCANKLIENEHEPRLLKKYHRALYLFAFSVITAPLGFRYIIACSVTSPINVSMMIDPSVENVIVASSLSPADWIVIVVTFVYTCCLLGKLSTILGGLPTSPKASSSVDCTGSGVLVTCTPIVAENEPIFLRNLIGRCALTLHTVNGRHSIDGMYIDAVCNESRSVGDDNRLKLWAAWMLFMDDFKDNLESMRNFLTAWSKIISSNDSIYDYDNRSQVISSIFHDAPVHDYFADAELLRIIDKLDWLEKVFNGKVSSLHPRLNSRFRQVASGNASFEEPVPLFRDECYELIQYCSNEAKDQKWELIWCYFSRAMFNFSPGSVDDNTLLECTKIKTGSIVYIKTHPKDTLEDWIKSRSQIYRVTYCPNWLEGSFCNATVELEPWPLSVVSSGTDSSENDGVDIENNESTSSPATTKQKLLANVDDLSLIMSHRGKAGAMNTFTEYVHHRSRPFRENSLSKIKELFAIIDARHMVVMPDIFWNDALPYFAIVKNGSYVEDAKGFEHSKPCMLVQYPQYFSNVKSDILNNRVGSFYTISQLLADCSKCVCSSGSNAIWDVTNPSFRFSATTRTEDTATTIDNYSERVVVYLSVFVAAGVTKKAVDFMDAWYRWTAGGVELFWVSLFNCTRLFEILYFGIIVYFFGIASFHSSFLAYIVWLLFIVGRVCYAEYEKRQGLIPYRSLALCATTFTSTIPKIYEGVSSITFTLILPCATAFFGAIPLGENANLSFSLVITGIFIRIPTLRMHQELIGMVKILNPRTADVRYWDFYHNWWRAAQLDACFFSIGLLASTMGTIKAFRSMIFHTDNTFWVSFQSQAADVTLTNTWKDLKEFRNRNFYDSFLALKAFLSSLFSLFASRIGSAKHITGWYATFVILFQVVCIIAGSFCPKLKKLTYLLLIMYCLLNIFLAKDIALHLFKPLYDLVKLQRFHEYPMIVVAIILFISVSSSMGAAPLMKMFAL
eukprot:gene4440-6279_t